MKISNLIYLMFCMMTPLCSGQQQADEVIIPDIIKPRFKNEEGPKVYIDHKHHNFHKLSGRFKPFADLLKSDGYQLDSVLAYDKLGPSDILVISNPIHPNNVGNWQRPIYNAFSDDDILSLENWVKKGGKLLLIADHMPFAGAANALANQFGFEFCDGFAQLKKERNNAPDIFTKENNSLLTSVITDGSLSDTITSITTFTGSSFTIPKRAKGILKFTKEDVCLTPEIAWQLTETTKRSTLENSFQGAILNYGGGKVAVFGEAAMFTAQTITNTNGTFKFGFHAPSAPNNMQFIRNLLFWLSKNEFN